MRHLPQRAAGVQTLPKAPVSLAAINDLPLFFIEAHPLEAHRWVQKVSCQALDVVGILGLHGDGVVG